jgi:hypothetical protein
LITLYISVWFLNWGKTKCKTLIQITLVKNHFFLTKKFSIAHHLQLCYKWIFFKFRNKIMTITNKINSYIIKVYSWKHFSIGWSFVEYSWNQQCFQVEHPTMFGMLGNNVKHVSTKGLFLEYFWYLRFSSWHTIKTLICVKLF